MTDYTPLVRGCVPILPDVQTLAEYIDWPQLLYAWDFRGTPAAIAADPEKNREAEILLTDARALLQKIIDGNYLTPKGVCGVFACERRGDDLVIDGGVETFYTLRQQTLKKEGGHYYALADFVKPQDYVGAFAVTCGDGLKPFIADSKAAGDDYTAILAQSLSDRLAEAFAEYIHLKIRREIWGYAADETLTIPELLAEKYQGIRPAPGYPCQPDHSEKFTLFRLLDVTAYTGLILTESALMVPESSVCALCFARPQSLYFSLGRIAADQAADYTRRKGWSPSEAQKWLAPIL